VRAMMPLRPGDSTPFAFSVDASTRFEGSCRVLWVEEEGRVAGLKFTEISPQLLNQVRVWLAEEEPQPPLQPTSPVVPARPLKTLEELRQELRDELRDVAPRVEIFREKTPPVEVPQSALPEVEIPRVEIPRVEAPRAEEPVLGPGEEEISVTEGTATPPILRTGDEVLPESSGEQVHSKVPAFAGRASGMSPEFPAEPPALEPLAELDEGAQAFETHVRESWLNAVTVSLAIRILIFLAFVAGAIVYHQELGNALVWLGAKISSTPAVSSSQAPATTAPVRALPPSTTPEAPATGTTQSPSPAAQPKAENPPASTTETKKPGDVPAVVEDSPTASSKPATPRGARPTPTSNKPLGLRPLGEPNSEAGQQEYLQAQEILKSKDRRGFSEAVRLLWIAVEKGNSNAEVSLAELYRYGEGVTKNCDQTKILLTAAARKGNAEGLKRLEQVQQEGCE
jgi:hypothetical protein